MNYNTQNIIERIDKSDNFTEHVVTDKLNEFKKEAFYKRLEAL